MQIRTALQAGLVLLLAGCGEPGPAEALERYYHRLARALDTAPSAAPAEYASAPLPRRRALRHALHDSNLSGLDFLALTGCEVQITLGKRNSSLGKVASDSQRLLLDLEFLALAPPCIEHKRQHGERQLANTLSEAYTRKQAQLPQRIYNATLANDEFRQFWRTPATLGDYPASTSSVIPSALAALNAHVERWLTGDYQADNRAFELLLAEIAQGDGGLLTRALAEQARWLHGADQLLAQRATAGPLCAHKRRPAAADILPNVVRKYFIGEVQPWSAALGRRAQDLLQPIRALETQLQQALPPIYRDWKNQREVALALWGLAPRDHVMALQSLLSSCSTTLGAGDGN